MHIATQIFLTGFFSTILSIILIPKVDNLFEGKPPIGVMMAGISILGGGISAMIISPFIWVWS